MVVNGLSKRLVARQSGLYLEFPYSDINKSCFFHVLLLDVIFDYTKGSTEFVSTLPENFRPLIKGAARKHRAIVAINFDGVLVVFKVSTWLTASESLLVKGFPVNDRAEHCAHVNVIKSIIGPCPVLIGVIQLEFEIRGYPTGLNWRQIRTDDLALGELVCKVTGIC